MIQEPNWPEYADKVHDWIQSAYARVYKYQGQMSEDQRKIGMIALYCLLMAHEYMEIAFCSFHKKRYHPGRACLRPVAEMAIRFWWCTFSVEDYVDKATLWMKDLFDKQAKNYERLEEQGFCEFDKEALEQKKAKWKEWYGKYFENVRGEFPKNIFSMIEEIDGRENGEYSFKFLYPTLYNPLCSSAHGVFEPGRYFEPKNEVIDCRKHAPMPPDTPWASMTSIAYLIVAIYRFFGWEYSEFLKEYKQIRGMSNP